ncbi:hypothetical protein ACFL27_11300 [candidate division CSSED10-310 bacterium]|uniref:Uncharacterized protein n=1 Tax=candidate division CSSED10-310 bacterium TaxID=2855610 RepID=A0ABV6YX67_UNCC1
MREDRGILLYILLLLDFKDDDSMLLQKNNLSIQHTSVYLTGVTEVRKQSREKMSDECN